MAHAEMEHVSSVLRVWNDGNGYGDPFIWAVAVRWITKSEVEILLQQKQLTSGIYRAVMSEMRQAGVKRILVRTFPDGADGPQRSRWLDVTQD